MRQIIPFKKELLFKTKVSEITSISLEHTLSLKDEDTISGEFTISGDYKMTEGSINREKFDFICPFEITLDGKYKLDSIIIDIDNFYYEVVNNESLQVNIDVYVEGDKIEEITETSIDDRGIIKEIDEENISELEEKNQLEEETIINNIDTKEEINKEISTEEDIINDKNIEYNFPQSTSLIDDNTPNIVNNSNNKTDFNIFNNIDESDTYVTYYVYIIKEEDTLNQIIEKFNIKKEELEKYNDLANIKPKDKLIIPISNE